MKKIIILLFPILILLPQFLSSQTTRGMKVMALDPRTGEQIELYTDSYAVIVGINKYRNVPDLNYAVADAEAIKNMLIKSFYFKPENITILTDIKATKKGILDAFAALLETSPNDRAIIFFAGHGTQTELPGGGEMGYLVPYEGKINTKSELYSTCLSMEELKNISKQIPAKHLLCLVDACYGGLAAVITRALSRETQLYLQKISSARARQIITAGGRGELAVESPDWGHSAFTKSILEGLEKKLADIDGNRLITASELAAYLKPKVTAASENKQTPQFKSFTDEEGDFVFVLSTTFELQVSSVPAGASVKINSKEEGKTPYSQKLEMDTYNLELNLPGYQPYKETVNLKKDTKITATLKEELFEVAITSNPGDAEVFINGIPQPGKTTLITKVRPGAYTIEVSKDGYQKWSRQIDIKTNQTVTADLTEVEVAKLEKEMDTKFVQKKSEEPKEEKPAEPPAQEKVEKGSNTIWWVAGGAAVVAGGAYFLLAKKSKSETPGGSAAILPAPPPLP